MKAQQKWEPTIPSPVGPRDLDQSTQPTVQRRSLTPASLQYLQYNAKPRKTPGFCFSHLPSGQG